MFEIKSPYYQEAQKRLQTSFNIKTFIQIVNRAILPLFWLNAPEDKKKNEKNWSINFLFVILWLGEEE